MKRVLCTDENFRKQKQIYKLYLVIIHTSVMKAQQRVAVLVSSLQNNVSCCNNNLPSTWQVYQVNVSQRNLDKLFIFLNGRRKRLDCHWYRT